MSNTVEPPTVPFFKKKSRPANARQRSPSSTSAAPSNNGASTSSDVVRPTLKASANPLIQGTKRTFSQRERDEDDGPDVKWKAAGANPREAAELQLEILEGEEAAEILKKAKRDMERDEDDTPDDGLYKGQAGYKNHIKKREMVEVPKAMRIGPQRSSNTIKTVTLVDYQPDVCKDYKETGYCGFGDTCKFLHDRGTYLAGWQLDKLAENPKKTVEEEDTSDDEEIPFACFICRKPYTDPVVTRCSHYFCSACAIKRFSKTPKCAACGAPTGGIFNRADKVVEKAKAKQEEKAEKARAKEEEEGGGVAVEGLKHLGDSSDEDSD